MFRLIFASFLLMVVGHARAEECDKDKFRKCIEAIGFEHGYYFPKSNNSQEFKDSCPDRLESVRCGRKYAPLCTTPEQYAIWSALQNGVMKAVEDLCTEGTYLNEAYLKNIDCLKKMEKDIKFCDAKHVESQNLINSDNNLAQYLKMFHSCCAYDWQKECKKRAAEIICGKDTKNYIEKVWEMQAGIAVSNCAAVFSGADKKCSELYGVDVGRPKGLFSSGSMLSASILIPFISLLFM